VSRSLTAGVASAVQAAAVPMLVLVEIDYDSGTARYCTAPFNLSWNGQTWLGVGALGAVDAVAETGGVEVKTIGVQLSGINPANIAVALAEPYQGRAFKLYGAPLDANHVVIADPKLLFAGMVDTMEIALGATASVKVTASSRLVDLERARVRRFNQADQQADYPDDIGFQFIEAMVDTDLSWGAPGQSTLVSMGGWAAGLASAVKAAVNAL